ncbi:hypothetical protein GUJ93_ZPchr0001g32215 [Zizania palustris]|uniref:Uncharacterized protein n=1 Tax=Zizania palustris TaxID=103762 RepID=A0A8J5S8L7_ZIZPA|nr:hypothetical protein GUJ93_ZPchr0001g32215 [Zizania palustris]
MDFDLAGNEMLVKFAVFIVVQALVYLILSQSSGVFSAAAGKAIRSASFRRSESVRRMAALPSEMMARPGGEPASPAGGKRGGRPNDDDGGDLGVELELELMLARCQFWS